MSSTERAPEPTMEEILASIRRIISDDEQNSARQRNASAIQQDEEGLEAAEGEADDKIINDIARVLSGASQPAEAELELGAEEEILDLTAELGGLEMVEETVILEAEFVEPELVEAAAPEAFQPAPERTEPEAEPAPEPQAKPVAQAPEPVPAPPKSASEEAASALERAIAALRAGQLPTSVAEFGTQPQPAPQPEIPAYAAPEDYAQPEPEPEPELQPEPAFESEPELVLGEFESEVIAEEPVLEMAAASEAEAPPAWEAEIAPWAGASEPLIEPERAARTNGHSAEEAPLDASHKSLEDSIKDMLRPMLQRWLDENMARVLTAALKDELRDNPARFERD
jgi:cell pole-organizing protein PopZ